MPALIERLEQRLCFNAFYVAPSGLDIFPGSFGQPLASLAAAARLARPGDFVYVRGGVYSPTVTQDLANVGVASARVTFEPYPGEAAILDGVNLPAGADLVSISGQYIDFQNFEVRNAKGADVRVVGQNIQVLNNSLHDAQQSGVFVGTADSLTQTQDVLVQNNSLYHDGLAAAPGTASVASLAAAMAFGASNVRFINNPIRQNNGPGLTLRAVSGGLVLNNLLFDNTAAQLTLDNATHVVVQKNFFYTTGAPAYFSNGAPADSIVLANGPYAISNPLDDVEILNNVVLGGRSNLLYSDGGVGGGLRRFLIANNDFYNATGTNISIDSSPGHQSTQIVDNIFDQPTGVQANLPAGAAGLLFQNNDWYNGPASVGIANGAGGAGNGRGAGDVYAEPDFASPGSATPASYRLLANSPAIDAGVTVLQVTDDYFQIARPEGRGPDIGAHEYLNSTPPPGPPPQPAPGRDAPVGLSATGVSPSEIDLTWSDSYANVAGFIVQRRRGGPWTTLGVIGISAGTGQYVDTNLRPNRHYSYRVIAIYMDGTQSSPSDKVAAKTLRRPKVHRVRPSRSRYGSSLQASVIPS